MIFVLCTLFSCRNSFTKNEKRFLTRIYHSPSQNDNEFQNFSVNFDALLNGR